MTSFDDFNSLFMQIFHLNTLNGESESENDFKFVKNSKHLKLIKTTKNGLSFLIERIHTPLVYLETSPKDFGVTEFSS